MEVFKDNANKLKSTLVILLAGAALTGCEVQAKADPAPAAPEQPVTVATQEAAVMPDISGQLIAGWDAALADFQGDIDIAVYDNVTGQVTLHSVNKGSATFDTASTIKLPILVEALAQGQAKNQSIQCNQLPMPTPLPCDQLANAVPMIENSDNNATETLFEKIGGQSAVQSLFDQAAPGARAGSAWGNSQVTAKDLVAIENLVAYPGSVLTPESAAAATTLMSVVESDQRWGIGAGVPAGVTFENKNGWLDDAETNDRFSGGSTWAVNSVGHVHGTAPNGRIVDYTEAIVSRGNTNYAAGQVTLNRVGAVTSAELSQ